MDRGNSKNIWTCIIDLENTQDSYAKGLGLILWLEQLSKDSKYMEYSSAEEFFPFRISRAKNLEFANRDVLLALENRITGKEKHNFSTIASERMLIDGLIRSGGEHHFSYYLRVHLNDNENDITELQYLVLLLQTVSTIRGRVAVRVMKSQQASWTTKDYFRVSNYLRFVQSNYKCFYACYTEDVASLQTLTTTAEGVQSTFLPLLEVDNHLCQLLNKTWKLTNQYERQSYNKLHTAIAPQGCVPGDMTWMLFQIGLRMLFASFPGRKYNSDEKKRELLTFISNLVEDIGGVTALDMLLFGALAGEQLKDNLEQGLAGTCMGNIQTLSLALGQILENIVNHSERNQGVFTFRIQQNASYLNSHYPGYKRHEGNSCLEVMIADSNYNDGIVDHFLKSSKADTTIKNQADSIRLAHLFGEYKDERIQEIWAAARKNRPEMCHGLRSFFASVCKFEGAVRVRSVPLFRSRTDRDMYYYNGSESSDVFRSFLNEAYIPGTQFSVVVDRHIPVDMEIADAVEKWALNFDELAYATTYRELAQALRFDENVRNLPVVEALTPQKLYIHNQEEKDAAVIEWKRWFDEKAKDVAKSRRVVFQCDVDEFCKKMMETPEIGEPFCKGLLSSTFFVQNKPEEEKVYYCLLIQNLSAQFSRYFAEVLSAMEIQDFDLSYVSVYFYPKQSVNSVLPYRATTFHKLVKQPLNLKEFPKIFPYTLFLKGQLGHSLFEEQMIEQANNSIFDAEQGFKIADTHMRLGNKVHLDSFYEMALFFENPNYAYYTAFLMLKVLLKNYSGLIQSKHNLLLYGYASYSRAVVWAIQQILDEYWKLEALSETVNRSIPEIEFVIYQNDLKLESDQPQVQMYYSVSEWQQNPNAIWNSQDTVLVMVVPISSSMTTFNKMKEELKHATGVSFDNNISFTAFWVRNHYNEEHLPSREEERFWESADPIKKTISSHLVNGKIHYLRYATSEWSDPLKCQRCFPTDVLLEYPLVETDPTSTIPTQQFYLNPPNEKPDITKECPENDSRVARLAKHVLYGHISKGGNHYQYYIKSRTYFQQERDNVAEWLRKLRKKDFAHNDVVSTPECINVLIIPQQIDNVEFGQFIYEHYFQANAECVVINTEKEFRSNIWAEYSGLFQRLRDAIKDSKQLVRFYFADISIRSGNSFNRAMSLVSSGMRVLGEENSEVNAVSLEKIFLLVNRLSESSKQAYVDEPSQNFHSYAELHISAMRTFGDSCIPCKVQHEAMQYYKKAATKSISSYWEKKVHLRRCIPFDQFELPTIGHTEQEKTEMEAKQKKGFQRMLCAHRAAHYIRPVQGYNKSFYFAAVRSFLEELRSCNKGGDVVVIYKDLNDANRKEWISAGLKVIVRPFFTFDYRMRCAVMDLLLILSELLISRVEVGDLRRRLEGAEKAYAKNYLLENDNLEWCKSFADDLLKLIGDEQFEQMKFIRSHILKGLADIKSNYIIRRDTILHISQRLSEMIEASGMGEEIATEFYDHYLRSILRVIHSSSDETKGIWLEYLLQYGEEYSEWADNELDANGISRLICQVPINVQKQLRDFLEVLLVENNRPIYQAVVEYYAKAAPNETANVFLNQYHMRSAKKFMNFGYNKGTDRRLRDLTCLLQPGRDSEDFASRYQSLGEDINRIVQAESKKEKGVIVFGAIAETKSRVANYLSMTDYFTLFPTRFQEEREWRKTDEKTEFEAQWRNAKYSREAQKDLKKTGFHLMQNNEENTEYDVFDVIIKLDNNYDDLNKGGFAQDTEISIQKIDPIYIFIPCALSRQHALVLTRKILMFRCKLIEWLEKDFNNNAIAILSQQQHIAKILSTDKVSDHAELDFVECQQQLLMATDKHEFLKERDRGTWINAVDEMGKTKIVYSPARIDTPPLNGLLQKPKEWYFLRSYVNSRISRLFRNMVRSENELQGDEIIDIEKYYSCDAPSVLMRPVDDFRTLFFTPIKSGYIRKNYLRLMMNVITFCVQGEMDYKDNCNASVEERLENLAEQFRAFRCIRLCSEKNGREYAYLSEHFVAILLDCFVSGVKAGKTWNEAEWSGDAYRKLSKKTAGEKCVINISRERGYSFGGYEFDYLVISNKIHHTQRVTKKGQGMSLTVMRWYIDSLWYSCIKAKDELPVVWFSKEQDKYVIKLPILKREGEIENEYDRKCFCESKDDTSDRG